jgi:hypothetical protein
VKCLYYQKEFQYKKDRVMNHFGYNARSTQIVCPNIPPALKDKFVTCNNVVPTRMSALELWGTGNTVFVILGVWLGPKLILPL